MKHLAKPEVKPKILKDIDLSKYDLYEWGTRIKIVEKDESVIKRFGRLDPLVRDVQASKHLTDEEYQQIKPFLTGVDEPRLVANPEVTASIPKELEFLAQEARKYKSVGEFFEKVIKKYDDFAPEYRNPIIEYWRKTVMKPLEHEAYEKDILFSTDPISLEHSLDNALKDKYTSKQLENMSVKQKAIKILGEDWTEKYRKEVLGKGAYQLITDFYNQATKGRHLK